MDEFNRSNPLSFIKKFLKQKIGSDSFDIDNYIKNSGLKLNCKLINSLLFGFSTSVLQPEEIQIAIENISELMASILKDCDLVTFDDFQWLDNMSLKVFGLLVPKLNLYNTKILITSRPTQNIDIIKGYKGYEVDLSNLTLPDITLICRKQIPNITQNAIEAIFSITEGNPLFVTEMCRIIKSRLDTTNEITGAQIELLLQNGIIPQNLENLFVNQYENLDAEAKQVLKIASIVGRAFSVAELQVIGREYFTSEIVTILKDLNLVKVIDEQNINPRLEYIFYNNLMRESIYRTILKSEKRELHSKIGSYYESLSSDNPDQYLEVIANHYLLADNKPMALKYSLLAGKKNLNLHSLTESAFYYESALNLQTSAIKQEQTRLVLIEIAIMQGKLKRAEKKLSNIANNLQNDLKEKAVYLQSRIYSVAGNHQKAKEYIEKELPLINSSNYKNAIRLIYFDALRALKSSEKFESEILVFFNQNKDADIDLADKIASVIGQHYLDKSDYENSRRYFEFKLNLSQKNNNKISMRIALSSLGIINSRMGNKNDAMKMYQKALRIAEEMGDKNAYGKVLMDIAALYRNDGKNDEAIKLYEQSLTLAQSVGNREQEHKLIYNIGEAYYYKNDLDKALPRFYKAKDIAKAMNNIVGITYCNDAIGDSLFTLGKIPEAEDVYRQNLKLQQNLDDSEGIAHTYGNLGNIAKAKKEYDTALQFYGKQYDMLNTVGDKDGQGRASFNTAMIYIEKSMPQKAVPKLTEAKKLFDDCGAKYFSEITQQQIDHCMELIDS